MFEGLMHDYYKRLREVAAANDALVAAGNTPRCPHHGDMRPSKYNEGQWYCPHRNADGTRCAHIYNPAPTKRQRRPTQ